MTLEEAVSHAKRWLHNIERFPADVVKQEDVEALEILVATVENRTIALRPRKREAK